MQELAVELGARSYPIYIGGELLASPGLIQRHVRGRQVMLVSNEVVAPLYLKPVQAALTEYQTDICILPDGEANKTTDILAKIYDALLAAGHNRTTTLLALGGGVVGDMTGFAAATYQRGVDFIQLPTTLLAQVDSSVGGKTGVNHALGKNMIGAFHQPQAVLIDTNSLESLPDREVAAGIAEVIKYGLIADPRFFDWLESNMTALVAKEQGALTYAIRRSCENKASIVAADEREGGIRAILNLGHTFGHAIETDQGYGSLLHGEAVAIGMVIAARLSVLLGALGDAEFERIESLLVAAGLPVTVPEGMASERFLSLMAVDKKVVDGRLRLVLLQELGKAEIRDDIETELVVRAIELCRQGAM